jgi:hypothetical protein
LQSIIIAFLFWYPNSEFIVQYGEGNRPYSFDHTKTSQKLQEKRTALIKIYQEREIRVYSLNSENTAQYCTINTRITLKERLLTEPFITINNNKGNNENAIFDINIRGVPRAQSDGIQSNK